MRANTFHSKQNQLLTGRLGQPADTKPEQAERSRNQLVPAQQKAAQPINVVRLADRLPDGDLAGEGREIAVADFHLHGLRAETFVFELGGNFVSLFAQTAAQHFSIRGVAQKSVFAADAFDFVTQLQRPIILAKSKTLENRPP